MMIPPTYYIARIHFAEQEATEEIVSGLPITVQFDPEGDMLIVKGEHDEVGFPLGSVKFYRILSMGVRVA